MLRQEIDVMDKTTDIWRVPIAVEAIPEAGLHLKLEAPEAVRVALARAAGLRSLPAFKASFDLARRGRGVHVGGRIEAIVGQTCVVTLEPIDCPVSEDLDLLFSPAVPRGAQDATGEAQNIGYAADEKEPPEPLVRGSVDLGAVAIELLMLGIDPYPRKAGAEFVAQKLDADPDRPFAALAALKKNPGGSTS
jgi:uncharacterized protein DUF177 involved in 23S rRNA accumulation